MGDTEDMNPTLIYKFDHAALNVCKTVVYRAPVTSLPERNGGHPT
jgi:hypothetical protein